MRKRRLAKNTISSFVFQICTVISGFILPRLILDFYGSEVNGLVNSISQFLALISFLELGVGAVVQSALYKPLAEKDNDTISKIIVSANKFFRHIGEILLVYVAILIVIYPYIAHQNFGKIYTAILIAAMSISSFAQYYFGVVDRLLLTADQRGYIQYNAQTITLIGNTVLCAIMMLCGGSIHLVKLTTSLVYLVRPIVLRIYVNKHYEINREIKYNVEPIGQKWNGIAQHVSTVVLDNTDTIVLTVLANLSDVSIYSVYHLVVYGVKYLFISMTNGVQSLLGELWALNDEKEMNNAFEWTEWILHTGITLVFGCTGMLIIPFIQVYTKGITDVNYIQPVFAGLIVLAHATHCIRIPYHMMIKAGGHYKETQSNYIIATVLNILISVATVKLWGLVGVAIGTFVAMAYQTVWMAYYNSKILVKRPVSEFIKQLFVDAISVVVGIMASFWIKMPTISYIGWLFLAVITLVIWSLIILIINSLLYRDKIKRLIEICTKKILRK